MKHSSKLRRLLSAAVAALALFTGCVSVDNTLGENLVPDNEQMKAGYTLLNELSPRKLIETRLYQTDTLIGSNLSFGYMGAMLSDTFGLRKAGFLSQFTNYYKVEEGYFGYRPIFDSAQIMLKIETFGADTLTDQTFAIYEVTSNRYITENPIREGETERDTTFFVNFDPTNVPWAGNILGDKLFTFSLGESTSTGPSTGAVTLKPTDEGRRFIRRLMLQEGKYKDDYSIYSTDNVEQWVEEFNGLYIVPETVPTTTDGGKAKGTIYATTLNASGLSVYGRNRREDNPSLIKDTIGMVYYFYDSGYKHGNVSVNTISHDYTRAKFRIEDARETNDDRPKTTTLYVSGMGGVVSELTFTENFFNALKGILDKENAESGRNFKTFAFSQAKLSIYFTGSGYDWENLPDIPHLVDQMNAAQKRLGLYVDYKSLTAIPDYAYIYEQNYGLELTYGGYINRSRGCYAMDITGYVQTLWNTYLEECDKAEREGRAVDFDNLELRTIYLAPEAYSLFSDAYSVLQGEEGGQNNAPIRIELFYNMIK